MHAQWTPTHYTVTFNANGGTSVPAQTVASGEKAAQPGAVTKAPEGLYEGTVDVDTLVFTFDGWYDAAYTTKYTFTAPVTGNLDLYAKWTEPSVSPVDLSGQSGAHVLEKALSYIGKQPQGAEYTIALAGNYSMAGNTASINKANAVITLAGAVPAEIRLSSNGFLFYISAGELILGRNVTLKGLASNGRSPVYVGGASASLLMKTGAAISGNTGGGVWVVGSGSFTMEGGEISGNTASAGGGVSVWGGGNFTMEGGVISGNSASYGGGGVFVYDSGS
jgi:uncharacterized repeat protein (TIGR02543 family)